MKTIQQQLFLAKIKQLSGLLRFQEPTIALTIKGIWVASLHWQGGEPFDDCEDFAFRRFSWRVKDDLAPHARPDTALQLLAAAIPLGMLVFRDLDVPGDLADSTDFVAELTELGFDLRLYMPLEAAV